MPDLTEERFKEIIAKAIYLSVTESAGNVEDIVVDHPEIKSLFEKKEITLYHGSPCVIDDFGLKSGTFFTDDILVARDYGKFVYRIILSGDELKILARDIMQEHWINRALIPMNIAQLVIWPTEATKHNEGEV